MTAQVNPYRFIPKGGWACFHCGEVFTRVDEARTHFGVDSSYEPGCILKIEGRELGLLKYIRDLERQLQIYRDESDPISRYVVGLIHDTERKIREAEEAGYNRAVQDLTAEKHD